MPRVVAQLVFSSLVRVESVLSLQTVPYFREIQSDSRTDFIVEAASFCRPTGPMNSAIAEFASARPGLFRHGLSASRDCVEHSVGGKYGSTDIACGAIAPGHHIEVGEYQAPMGSRMAICASVADLTLLGWVRISRPAALCKTHGPRLRWDPGPDGVADCRRSGCQPSGPDRQTPAPRLAFGSGAHADLLPATRSPVTSCSSRSSPRMEPKSTKPRPFGPGFCALH